ncbi:MAG: hypothetical protein MI861_02345, partial [Pirellulales bacterium]|nr:hypothetical protein [Pirellulales bacterium]
AGDVITDINFGLRPGPGVITGLVFEDVVENGSLDPREPAIAGLMVFLDLNRDGRRQDNEPFQLTDPDGFYRFEQVPAFRQYAVAVQSRSGFEQVAPGAPNQFIHDFFLSAGGVVGGRNFGFRQVTGTGQSSSSSVSGKITDVNGLPVEDVIVYLDTQNFGILDENEIRTETDADGNYTITGLTSSVVAVTTQFEEEDPFTHVTPVGSSFNLTKFPLFDEIAPFGNPQAIATADFNADNWPDVAVVLSESNTISIRLNDRQGGFTDQKIDIDLGADGGGPTSLAVGQFNGAGTPLDIAVTNNFASNVIVLKDFNGSDFDERTTIPVGVEPLDIAAAPLRADANHLDLVLVNKADNSLQVLLNNGSGVF